MFSSYRGSLSIICVLTVLCLFYLYNGRISDDRGSFSGAESNTESQGSPVIPVSLIPKKIWYKVGPKGLSDQSKEWMDTCLLKNPSYTAEIMTDASGDEYVRKHFASRPDILETFLSLTTPIHKADFLRYLLLWAEGGIWNDLDVSCEDTLIDDWIPAQYRDKAGIVLGWEFDVGWGDGIVRQLASWTVMSEPRSPHMMMVINDIVESIYSAADTQQVSISDLRLNMLPDVVDFTGPRRLTRSVMKSMEASLGRPIDVHEICNLLEPKLMDDILILPGYSLAASANTYDGNNKTGPALVTHHYAGTWKNDHGGE